MPSASLLVIGVALWIVTGFLSRALVAVLRHLLDASGFRGPVRVALLVAGTAALWAHYGTAVFYEMIAAGIAACL